MTEMKPKKEYTLGQIFNNLALFSTYTQDVCRQNSYTKAESAARYDVWNHMNKKMMRWGNGGLFLWVVGFMTQCFKGKSALLKVSHGLFLLIAHEHIFNLSKATGVWFNVPWALRRLQIDEEGRLTQNLKLFFDQVDYRMAHPEEYISDATILTRCAEQYIELEGKKLERGRAHFVDETGRRVDTPIPQLMETRDKEKRLKYMDNFYTRYIYYNVMAWFGRVQAALGFK